MIVKKLDERGKIMASRWNESDKRDALLKFVRYYALLKNAKGLEIELIWYGEYMYGRNWKEILPLDKVKKLMVLV